MLKKNEVVMQNVLSFLKKLSETEEIVVTGSTALDLYCIEQGKEELITYPNAVFLDLFNDAEEIDKKVISIFKDMGSSIKVTKLPSESKVEYSIRDENEKWYLELYIDIKGKKGYKEATRQIEGLEVYQLVEYIVKSIDNLMEHAVYCEIKESVYLEDALRAIQIGEEMPLMIVNGAMLRLGIDFNKDSYSSDLCDDSDINIGNLGRFCKPLIQELLIYGLDEETRVWECVDSKIGKYDWVIK